MYKIWWHSTIGCHVSAPRSLHRSYIPFPLYYHCDHTEKLAKDGQRKKENEEGTGRLMGKGRQGEGVVRRDHGWWEGVWNGRMQKDGRIFTGCTHTVPPISIHKIGKEEDRYRGEVTRDIGECIRIRGSERGWERQKEERETLPKRDYIARS